MSQQIRSQLVEKLELPATASDAQINAALAARLAGTRAAAGVAAPAEVRGRAVAQRVAADAKALAAMSDEDLVKFVFGDSAPGTAVG